VAFHVPPFTTSKTRHLLWNNPLWKAVYRFDAEFEAGKGGKESRRGNTGGVYSDPPAPDGLMIVWPVFEGEESIRITNAIGRIDRQWNKIQLPFELPQRKWAFEVPPPLPIPK
jgi:hypothetical protein